MRLPKRIVIINCLNFIFVIPGLFLTFWTLTTTGQTLSTASSTTREAFFPNGTSYVELSERIKLDPGTLLGFSFRTCYPSGDLVRQIPTQLDFFRQEEKYELS